MMQAEVARNNALAWRAMRLLTCTVITTKTAWYRLDARPLTTGTTVCSSENRWQMAVAGRNRFKKSDFSIYAL